MRAPSVASRSRTRGWRTATGPMPVMISRSGRSRPGTQRAPIDDITTDTDNPPAFVAVIKLREAEDGNSSTYAGAETAALQKRGYPDLAPLSLALAPEKAFPI